MTVDDRAVEAELERMRLRGAYASSLPLEMERAAADARTLLAETDSVRTTGEPAGVR